MAGVRGRVLQASDVPSTWPMITLRIQIRTELSALQRRSGKSVVDVTHDQTEAMTMADRVLLMLEGRLIQDGPPREL